MNIPVNPRQCPNCGKIKGTVSDVRVQQGQLIRRRICPKCHFFWRTVETVIKESVTDV